MHCVAKLGDIHRAKRTRIIVYSNFLNTRPDDFHRLPIVWLKFALYAVQLMANRPTRRLRESAKVIQGVTEKDYGFHNEQGYTKT